MTFRINFNGNIQEEAFVSALDHGFLFGDSVYEVMCTVENRPRFMKEHLKRLKQSADAIGLVIPYPDEWFEDEISKTLDAAANSESYIRVVVTRGVGELDLDPSSCLNPNVLIYVKETAGHSPEQYQKGINIALVSIKRNPVDALNPGIKTGNYLNNVLAKMEANRAGASDALMLNTLGYLTECTTSNFFFVKQGVLMTPALECGILAGITRDIVLRLARENGIVVEEGEFPPEALNDAEEAFLTGTIRKVMPVTAIDNHPIGDGKPGPVTRRLMKLYEEVLKQP